MDESTKNRSPQPDLAGVRRNDEDRDSRRDRELRRKKALDANLERGLEDSFPASDPVAVIQPPHSPYDRLYP